MEVKRIVAAIEAVAPPRYQAAWDLSGVQVTGPNGDADRVAVTLDPLPDRIAEALDWGASLILSHHPLTLSPRLPDRLDDYHAVLKLLMSKDAWLYAAHTSLDVQLQGPPSWLARMFWLVNLRVIEPVASIEACEVRFDLEEELPAEMRAELVGHPGVVSLRETSGGLRVICDSHQRDAVGELVEDRLGRRVGRSTVMLEEPRRTLGFGIMGDFKEPKETRMFLRELAGILRRDHWIAAGPEPESVRTVAYCPGSGGTLITKAFAAGADVFITGDVKHHQALEAPGLVVDVGHHCLEERMMGVMADRLAAELQPHGVEVKFFAGPEPLRLVQPKGSGA